MARQRLYRSGIVGFLVLLFAVADPVHAQGRAPVVVYESILNGVTVHEGGRLAFGNVDLAFAPDEPVKASAAIVDSDGNVVGSVPFAEFYRRRDGVFGRITTSAHPAIVLEDPGLYVVAYVVDGQVVTRFPFLLRAAEASDDPFADPGKSLFGDGRWRQLAYLSTDTYRDEAIAVVTMWLGSADLSEPGRHFEPIRVSVLREGELVGQSKRRTVGFGNRFFERKQIKLFEPHAPGAGANAVMLPMSALTADGDYQVIVQREADDHTIRSFRFSVVDGAVEPLPQTRPDYQPRQDYIVPRVRDGGGDFVEAFWIASK